MKRCHQEIAIRAAYSLSEVEILVAKLYEWSDSIELCAKRGMHAGEIVELYNIYAKLDNYSNKWNAK